MQLHSCCLTSNHRIRVSYNSKYLFLAYLCRLNDLGWAWLDSTEFNWTLSCVYKCWDLVLVRIWLGYHICSTMFNSSYDLVASSSTFFSWRWQKRKRGSQISQVFCHITSTELLIGQSRCSRLNSVPKNMSTSQNL